VSRRGGLVLWALWAAACHPSGGGGASAGADPLAEARSFLDQGQPDAALARLQGTNSPEGRSLEGSAWARKAATAPLAGAAEFKAEELRAIDCFEKAAAAKPDLASAHLGLADLLAPHALAHAQVPAPPADHGRGAKKGVVADPLPLALAGPDASPERVVREYRMAAQADPGNKAVVDAWIVFAIGVGRVEEADAAFQELLKREKEKPEPFVRYGDFLLSSRKDAQGAIGQYAQALMWRPDDPPTRVKIADIYLGQASDHMTHKEWASAEARLRDAQKYVSAKDSPQAAKIQDMQSQIAQIRGRPPGR
jgi:tetratricopeptide (TPR) repeat protein